MMTQIMMPVCMNFAVNALVFVQIRNHVRFMNQCGIIQHAQNIHRKGITNMARKAPIVRCPECKQICIQEEALDDNNNKPVINHVCTTPGCINEGETIQQVPDPTAKD